MHRTLALPLALLVLATPLHAQQADLPHSAEFDDFAYGIICFHHDSIPDRPLTEDEIVALEEADQGDFLMRATATLEIPAIEYLTFGIIGSYPEGVEHEVQTTLTRTPQDGAPIVEVYSRFFDASAVLDGWVLETADGPLVGTYRFDARRGDETVYDVTFSVVQPEAYTGVIPACVPAP